MKINRLIIAEPYRDLVEKNCDFINRRGFELYYIKTNDEALEMQKIVKAHLIITGIDMPGIKGEELCELIRKDDKTKTVSIIMLCTDRNDIERCHHCRANAFLSPHAAGNAFADTVRRLLSIAGRAAMRAPVSIRVEGKTRKSVPFLAFSENLSSTGMLLESEKELDKGEIITCSFFIGDNTHIVINAEVVRVRKRKIQDELNQYGLMFLNHGAEVVKSIDTFVQRQLARQEVDEMKAIRKNGNSA